MPKNIKNTNDILAGRAKNKKIVANFFRKLKLLNDQNALPHMISVPAPVFKYMARGRYGAETKRMDIQWADTWTQPAYLPDQGGGTGPFNGMNIDDEGAAVQAINLVQQGTSVVQRVGNKIALKSVKFAVYLSDVDRVVLQARAYPFVGRAILVYDRQPNGIYPDFYQMFNGLYPDGVTPTNSVLSPLDVNQLQRYSVLMDKKILFPPNILPQYPPAGPYFPGYIGSTIPEPHFMIHDFVPLHDLETMFNSTIPFGITQINTGALYFVAIADISNANSPWFYIGPVRLTFHDI